jgi:DNA repair exonuclease SbcCD ATPase subunit
MSDYNKMKLLAVLNNLGPNMDAEQNQVISDAIHEIDRLRAEVEDYRNGYKGSCFCCEPVALKNQELRAEVASLKEERDALRRKVYANTDNGVTIDGRIFSVDGDGYIQDNNFDYDAGMKLSGDFGGADIKQQYAQMICNTLNSHCPLTQQLVAANTEVEALKSDLESYMRIANDATNEAEQLREELKAAHAVGLRYAREWERIQPHLDKNDALSLGEYSELQQQLAAANGRVEMLRQHMENIKRHAEFKDDRNVECDYVWLSGVQGGQLISIADEANAALSNLNEDSEKTT